LSSRPARIAVDSTDRAACCAVDPYALRPGNPGFVTAHNMASVRRVASGQCEGQQIVFNKILPAIVQAGSTTTTYSL
jgi:hypothetical protein